MSEPNRARRDRGLDEDAGPTEGNTPWSGRGLDRYERVISQHDSRVRDTVADLLPTGALVLDVGCGNQLMRSHHHGPYVGLDWERDLNPDVIGDSQLLPVQDDAVDVALAKNHLQHVDDWQATIAGMCRVAREGVVIVEPCWMADTTVISEAPVRRRIFDPFDIHRELGGGEYDALRPDERLMAFRRWF